MSGQLKEVRERIKSVKSTQQITKAMKMVSAAKLRKAQDAIVALRPYSDKLDQMLRNILSNIEGDASSSFGQERPVEKILIVPVTSSRGLCGAFNANIVKEASKLIAQFDDVRKAGNLTIMPLGKKGYDGTKNKFKDCTFITDHIEIFSDLSFDNVSTVSINLMQEFTEGTYDKIYVTYGRFKNAALQFAEAVQFLPVEKIEAKGEMQESKLKADYIFEPSKEELLENLIPSILQTTFQKFLLDTNASEHGARMTAMDKATENAEEIVKDLKISYNKARQEAITKELSEIVGGAAALGG